MQKPKVPQITIMAVSRSRMAPDGSRVREATLHPSWALEAACEACSASQARCGCDTCECARIEEATNGRR